MNTFLLEYELVEDYLERRPAFREEHLALAGAARDRGELLLAGALADPPDRAILVFRSEDRSAAETSRATTRTSATGSFSDGPCGSGRS
jgi:hypothetical protein